MVDLQGVGVARGLTDKGYIYTDRPAYRAGQIGPRPRLPAPRGRRRLHDREGQEFTVEVFDSRNRLVRQEAGHAGRVRHLPRPFRPARDQPPGQYRVLVHDDAGQNYQGTFQVHEYQLEPVRLVVDTPRRVYYRGEEIEGTIRADVLLRRAAGRPRNPLPIGRRPPVHGHDRRQRRSPFQAATREFSETQVLAARVVAARAEPDNRRSTSCLPPRGSPSRVSTVRPVYVAGETFEATVNDQRRRRQADRAETHAQGPRADHGGRQGRRAARGRASVATAADGAARQTLKLEKGGNYVLRAEGIDRFHNPITGQCAVQVSGDEDSGAAAYPGRRPQFKVGDTAAVQVHWREEPALALVTFQGARVLDYRLVQLQDGRQRLSIPMAARLAPNFDLAVAVMTDARKGAPTPRDCGRGGGRAARDRRAARRPLPRGQQPVQRGARPAGQRSPSNGKDSGGDEQGSSSQPPRPGEDVEVTDHYDRSARQAGRRPN